jgi:hypothetical protein
MARNEDAQREAHGMRPDGYPNRPLTAWTIKIEDAPL